MWPNLCWCAQLSAAGGKVKAAPPILLMVSALRQRLVLEIRQHSSEGQYPRRRQTSTANSLGICTLRRFRWIDLLLADTQSGLTRQAVTGTDRDPFRKGRRLAIVHSGAKEGGGGGQRLDKCDRTKLNYGAACRVQQLLDIWPMLFAAFQHWHHKLHNVATSQTTANQSAYISHMIKK